MAAVEKVNLACEQNASVTASCRPGVRKHPVLCTPVSIIITSISPTKSTVTYGKSVIVDVQYKTYSAVKLTDLVVQFLGYGLF